MHSPMNVYEVRCPRCKVSFPVGTRKCMHCGGTTVHPDHLESIVSQDLEPIGPYGSASPGPAEQTTDSLFSLPDFSSNEREIEDSEEGSTSIGKTIIRGLGGFVWVIVLIGFTLVRNCGGD